MECISCGYELPEGAKFCGKCGAKQEKPPVFCMNCGAKIEDGMVFCMECGTPVGKVVESAPDVKAVVHEVGVKKENTAPTAGKALKGNKYNVCWRDEAYSSISMIGKDTSPRYFIEYKNKLFFMTHKWDIINAPSRDNRGPFVLGIMDNSQDEVTFYELGEDEYNLSGIISFTIFNDKVYYIWSPQYGNGNYLKSFDLKTKKIEDVQQLKDLDNWVSTPIFDAEGNLYYLADIEDGSKSYLMNAAGKKILECAGITAYNDRYIYFTKDYRGQTLFRFDMSTQEKVDIVKKYMNDSEKVLFVDPTNDTLYVADSRVCFKMGEHEFKGISLVDGSECVINTPKVELSNSQLSQHKMCFNGKNYIFRKNPVRGEGNFGIILFDKKGNIISDCLEMYSEYHNESNDLVFTQNYVVSIFRDPNSGGKEGYCLANVNMKSKAITPILQIFS